jgi:hypothetical protein
MSTKFHPCPLYPESCPLPTLLSPSQNPRDFRKASVIFVEALLFRANERSWNLRELATISGALPVAFIVHCWPDHSGEASGQYGTKRNAILSLAHCMILGKVVRRSAIQATK